MGLISQLLLDFIYDKAGARWAFGWLAKGAAIGTGYQIFVQPKKIGCLQRHLIRRQKIFARDMPDTGRLFLCYAQAAVGQVFGKGRGTPLVVYHLNGLALLQAIFTQRIMLERLRLLVMPYTSTVRAMAQGVWLCCTSLSASSLLSP